MSQSIETLAARRGAGRITSAVSSLAKRILRQKLSALRSGRITVADGARTDSFGQDERQADLTAAVTVIDRSFYGDVVFGGSLGAAESYIRGAWACDDLTKLCRIFASNLHLSDGMERGWGRLAVPAAKLFHWLHRNSQNGSRQNIEAHYDLGNDFYRLFLDETMMYSCGIFEHDNSSLREASVAKIDRICQKLVLRPTDHVLEIGTGWGGWAIHAASKYGCRVTTTTISPRQYELAVERVLAAGLEDRITILLRDYRDLEGEFDKLVSIEMIEAVGDAFLAEYFSQASRLLKPGGLMALQAITTPDHRYKRYLRGVDFIQRYIFPGSCLPSVTAMCRALAKSSDLRPIHMEDIGPHYARTLREWRLRFFDRIDDVRALGFSDEFIRMWEYYLCYCEAGFLERHVGDVQLVLAKPGNRREAILGEFEPEPAAEAIGAA